MKLTPRRPGPFHFRLIRLPSAESLIARAKRRLQRHVYVGVGSSHQSISSTTHKERRHVAGSDTTKAEASTSASARLGLAWLGLRAMLPSMEDNANNENERRLPSAILMNTFPFRFTVGGWPGAVSL